MRISVTGVAAFILFSGLAYVGSTYLRQREASLFVRGVCLPEVTRIRSAYICKETMTKEMTTRALIRTVGVMAIAVAAAWAFQVLGLGGSSAFGRLLRIVGAAAVAGAGAGLLYTSSIFQVAGAARRA